jgi:hypothetical protein
MSRHIPAAGRRAVYERFSVLERERDRLFPDGMFSDVFSSRGRRSVPPSVVAVVMVLQRLPSKLLSFSLLPRWASTPTGRARPSDRRPHPTSPCTGRDPARPFSRPGSGSVTARQMPDLPRSQVRLMQDPRKRVLPTHRMRGTGPTPLRACPFLAMT